MLLADIHSQVDLRCTKFSENGSARNAQMQLASLFEAQAPRSSMKTTQRHDLSAVNIVYVDDDPILCRLLPGILSKYGASVTAIHNDKLTLAEVLKKIPENTNLLISDYSMEGTDGLTLIASIKKSHPNITCVLTSASTQEDVIKGLNIPFMPKKIGLEERKSFLVDLCQKNGL